MLLITLREKRKEKYDIGGGVKLLYIQAIEPCQIRKWLAPSYAKHVLQQWPILPFFIWENYTA